MKVMIVDDDVDFIEVMSYINFPGAEVSFFSKPLEAIKEIENLKPEIVVLDVMMPIFSGVKILKILNESLFVLKIVIISGNSKEQIEKDFGSLGENIFFRKPLGDEFMNHMNDLVKEVELEIRKRDELESLIKRTKR